MLPFDLRLARHLSTVGALSLLSAGCSKGPADTATPSLEAMCDGAAGPDGYLLELGYVTISPGTECPLPADAPVQVDPCTFLEWQEVTCELDHVERDQVLVDYGYGARWVDAGATPTGYPVVGPVVDVCFYEAVFFDDPESTGTCGRPLLAEGEPQLAAVRRGPSPWSSRTPTSADLTEAERAGIGAWWLEAARMEHASVASFAVCALDLVRFGAPPELLAATHLAALDEIRHARLCFSISSTVLGEDLGPAPMSDLTQPASATLADFAEALFREGCIGETLAAVDAATRLAVARDPAVREALEVILEDESRHAALAWRTLGWVLAQDQDGRIRARLDAVLATERARWAAEAVGPMPSPAALAHGMLPAPVRARELARALAEVVGPAWAAVA